MSIITVLIYFICFFVASVIQAIMRSMLQNGDVSFIPGSVIFYLVAYWVARKWNNSYKERKEQKKIQIEQNEMKTKQEIESRNE